MTDVVWAGKMGDRTQLISGHRTRMRASNGENWPVPCDRPLGDADLKDLSGFEEWFRDHQFIGKSVRECMEMAWLASRQVHKATLRRTGWLDQKGRVWTETPSTADFDGGSLTPLLIDARED